MSRCKTKVMSLKHFLCIAIFNWFTITNAQNELTEPLKTFSGVNNKKSAKSNSKAWRKNTLDMDLLNADEISDLYWYLKSSYLIGYAPPDAAELYPYEVGLGYRIDPARLPKNWNKISLLNYSDACLDLEHLDLGLRLEITYFIENEVFGELDRSGSSARHWWHKLDNHYNFFARNKNEMTTEDIDKYFDFLLSIEKTAEYKSASQVYKKSILYVTPLIHLPAIQLEKTKRDPSDTNYTKLIELITNIHRNDVFGEVDRKYEIARLSGKEYEFMPGKDLFHYFIELNYSDLNVISEKFITNNELVLKYADMLIEGDEYQKAIDFLYKAEATPQVKMRIFRIINRVDGVIAATDYLMAQKPQAKSWNSVISEAVSDISSQERYNLIKHLYENNKSSLDSLDFTLIFGYGYFKSGIDKNDEIIWQLYSDKLKYMDNTNPELLEEKHKFITKILKEFNYKEELLYHEDIYWKNRIILESAELGCGYSMCFEIANNYVKQGKAPKKMCSSHFYNMALSMKEGLSGRGQRFTTEFEKPYKEVLDLCNKSLQLDRSNALNYKLMGDVWATLGNTNKSQYNYGLATKNGVDMKDRPATSSGKSSIRTGPRGGKYYVNSNGNRTYVK